MKKTQFEALCPKHHQEMTKKPINYLLWFNILLKTLFFIFGIASITIILNHFDFNLLQSAILSFFAGMWLGDKTGKL